MGMATDMGTNQAQKKASARPNESARASKPPTKSRRWPLANVSWALEARGHAHAHAEHREHREGNVQRMANRAVKKPLHRARGAVHGHRHPLGKSRCENPPFWPCGRGGSCEFSRQTPGGVRVAWPKSQNRPRWNWSCARWRRAENRGRGRKPERPSAPEPATRATETTKAEAGHSPPPATRTKKARSRPPPSSCGGLRPCRACSPGAAFWPGPQRRRMRSKRALSVTHENGKQRGSNLFLTIYIYLINILF